MSFLVLNFCSNFTSKQKVSYPPYFSSHFPLIEEKEENNEPLRKSDRTLELKPRVSTTKTQSTSVSGVTTLTTSSQYFHEPEALLSPIMEASREFRCAIHIFS